MTTSAHERHKTIAADIDGDGFVTPSMSAALPSAAAHRLSCSR
jgi:hypothetical protein